MLIGPELDTPRWEAIAGGARVYFDDFPNVRFEARALARSNSQAYLHSIQRIIKQEPAAIGLVVTDAAADTIAVGEMIKQGIVVVTIERRLDVQAVFGHVEVDFAGAAELLGEHLTEIAAGKRTYVLVHEDGGDSRGRNMYTRFMAAARQQSGMKQLDQRSTARFAVPTGQLVRAMLTRFRHTALVVTLDDQVWLDNAPRELLGSRARFATTSAPPALWPALRDGSASALAGQLDGEIGRAAAEMLLKGIMDVRTSSRNRTVRSELVTAETLADFSRRYVESAGLRRDLIVAPLTTQPTDPP